MHFFIYLILWSQSVYFLFYLDVHIRILHQYQTCTCWFAFFLLFFLMRSFSVIKCPSWNWPIRRWTWLFLSLFNKLWSLFFMLFNPFLGFHSILSNMVNRQMGIMSTRTWNNLCFYLCVLIERRLWTFINLVFFLHDLELLFPLFISFIQIIRSYSNLSFFSL